MRRSFLEWSKRSLGPLVYLGLALLAIRELPPGVIGHNWDWLIPPSNEGLLSLREKFSSLWHDINMGRPTTVGSSVVAFFWLFTLPALGGVTGAVLSKGAVVVVLWLGAVCFAHFLTSICVESGLRSPRWGGFLGGLLYGFSPYIFCEIHGGAITQLVTYALFPLAPWCVLKIQVRPGAARSAVHVFIAAVVFFVLAFSIQKLVLAVLLSGALAISRFGLRSTLTLALRISVPWVCLNLCWLFPVALDYATLADRALGERSSFTEVNLRHAVPPIQDAFVGRGYFRDFITMSLTRGELLLGELALLGGIVPLAVLGWRAGAHRVQRFHLGLLLCALPFVTGARPPFGDTVLWLYQTFPLMNLFRSPQHFLILPTFALSAITGAGLAARVAANRKSWIIPLSLAFLWLVPYASGDLRSERLDERYSGGNGLGVFRLSPQLTEAARILDAGTDDERVLALPSAYSPYFRATEWQASGQGGDPFLHCRRRAVVTTDIFGTPAAQAAVRTLRDSIITDPDGVVERMQQLDVGYILVRGDVVAHFDMTEPPLEDLRRALPYVPGIKRIYECADVEIWQREDEGSYRMSVATRRALTFDGERYEGSSSRTELPAAFLKGGLERVESLTARPPLASLEALLDRAGREKDPQPLTNFDVEIVGSPEDAGGLIPAADYKVRIAWELSPQALRIDGMLPLGTVSAEHAMPLPRHLEAIGWNRDDPEQELTIDTDGDGRIDLSLYYGDVGGRSSPTSRVELPFDLVTRVRAAQKVLRVPLKQWRWRPHRKSLGTITITDDGYFRFPPEVGESSRQYLVLLNDLPPTPLSSWQQVIVQAQVRGGGDVGLKLRLSIDWTGDSESDQKLVLNPYLSDLEEFFSFDVPGEIQHRFSGLDVPACRVLAVDVVVSPTTPSFPEKSIEVLMKGVSYSRVTEPPTFQLGRTVGLALTSFKRPPGQTCSLASINRGSASLLGYRQRSAVYLQRGLLIEDRTRGVAVRQARQVRPGDDILACETPDVTISEGRVGWAVRGHHGVDDAELRFTVDDVLEGPGHPVLRATTIWLGTERAFLTFPAPGGGEETAVLSHGARLSLEFPIHNRELTVRLTTTDPESSGAIWLLQLEPCVIADGRPTVDYARLLERALGFRLAGEGELRFLNATLDTKDSGIVQYELSLEPDERKLTGFPEFGAGEDIQIKEIRLRRRATKSFPDEPPRVEVVRRERRSTAYRIVELKGKGEVDLILAEAYAPNWRAFRLPSEGEIPTVLGARWLGLSPLDEHFPVNGVVNGWRLSSSEETCRIALIYTPHADYLTGWILGLVGSTFWILGSAFLSRRQNS